MVGSRDHHTPALGNFKTTHWSLVLTAAHRDAPERTAALNALCQTYWYPLYAFVRRRGYDIHEAQDLTQSFFAHLVKAEILQSVAQQKGKFRSFLLASLKNLLANEWNRAHTIKRGGEFSIISWNTESGEDRYCREPSHDATPEKLFERSWALTLIQTVFEKLKKEYLDIGKGQLFEAIQASLSEGEGAETYGGIAAKLNLTEGAVKMSVLRMRRRFGYLLRVELAQTLADAGEVEAELRYLVSCLGT